MKKEFKNSLKIKIERSFLNPMTNRLAKVGEEMNVTKNQFWFKRIMLGDCIEIKNFKVKSEPVAVSKPKKGSK